MMMGLKSYSKVSKHITGLIAAANCSSRG